MPVGLAIIALGQQTGYLSAITVGLLGPDQAARAIPTRPVPACIAWVRGRQSAQLNYQISPGDSTA